MDVQAVGGAAVAPLPPENTDISAQTTGVANSGAAAAAGSASPAPAAPAPASVGAVAVAQPASGDQGAPAPPPGRSAGLSPIVAKLFGPPENQQPLNLNVSYRVVKDLDEIVTVFTDPRTGKEIAQFPPQILIGLAEFFAQHQGATLDKSA